MYQWFAMQFILGTGPEKNWKFFVLAQLPVGFGALKLQVVSPCLVMVQGITLSQKA